MAIIIKGQQLIVVMKHLKECGAKGHSRDIGFFFGFKVDKMNSEILIRAVKLFEDGNSLRYIGNELGLNRKLLSVFLKKNGFIIKAKTGNSGYDKMEIFAQGELLFLEGYSLKYICKKLQTSIVAFSRHLKSKGYEIQNNQTQEQKLEILNKLAEAETLFAQGISRTKIARMVRVNDNILVSHFKSVGLITSMSKYVYDETIFSKIDNEEKAYWLGFLYADGSITNSDRYSLELSLKESDREHIVKFQQFLKTDALTRI
jgi:hypothetical protein